MGVGVSCSYAETQAYDLLAACAPASSSRGAIVSRITPDLSVAITNSPGAALPVVAVPGGAIMGPDGRRIIVKPFAISKTEVTVEQYAACVAKEQCTEPGVGGYCNWGKPGKQLSTANCLSREQVSDFAKFAGGLPPTEAEWRYAASVSDKYNLVMNKAEGLVRDVSSGLIRVVTAGENPGQTKWFWGSFGQVGSPGGGTHHGGVHIIFGHRP